MASSKIRQRFLDFFESKSRTIVPGNFAWLILLCGLLFFTCGCGSHGSNATPAAAAVRLLDLEGKIIDPFQADGAKAVVFVFVRTDCPISNGYAPEIKRLCERFTSNGAVFWLVYVEPDVSTEDIHRHLKEYQLTGGALRDPKQDLVRACQVRVTPEAAVFAPGQRLVYRGRIDDRFVALGEERPAPTRRDLEEVLTAVTEGKPILPTSTKAVGCTIPVAR